MNRRPPKRGPGARRRTRRIKSTALIGRLRWNRRARLQRERSHAQLTPELVNRSLRQPGVRLALLAVFVLAVGIGALASTPVVGLLERVYERAPVKLETIAVQGNRRVSTQEVANATGLTRHAAIATVDTGKVIANLEAHPWIRSASVLYLPAGQLIVQVEEREPVAAVGSPSAESGALAWRLVDQSGVVFAVASQADLVGLPRLRSDPAPVLGERDPQLVEAIAVTARFPLLALEDESPATPQVLELPSDASDAGWVLHFSSPERRVILGRDALETRLERLALLLDADLEATRAAEVIDLRFAGRAILRGASASW